MRQTFEIPGRFIDLNAWNKLCYQERSKEKKRSDDRVRNCAESAGIRPCKGRMKYHVLWVEQNRKRDLDNIAFAKKFIQDGLVKAGIIHNDTYHEIAGFSDEFAYDPKNPRIVVTLEEI